MQRITPKISYRGKCCWYITKEYSRNYFIIPEFYGFVSFSIWQRNIFTTSIHSCARNCLFNSSWRHWVQLRCKHWIFVIIFIFTAVLFAVFPRLEQKIKGEQEKEEGKKENLQKNKDIEYSHMIRLTQLAV